MKSGGNRLAQFKLPIQTSIHGANPNEIVRGASFMIRLLLLIWVLPNSLIGLTIGLLGLITNGKVQLRRGCLEFHGGWVTKILNRLPPGGVLAMTLGHTIIGQNADGLAIARDHEHIHVRQYERWGPFFIPAYLICSAVLWFQKKDSYRDNPFEIEAYAKADPSKPIIRDDK
jgi:hypothetical protein